MIDPLNDEISLVQLINCHEDPALSVVNAARISYDNASAEFAPKDSKLCAYLWAHEHTSPYRHQHYTFKLCIPLFVARQLTKYQIASTWRSFEAGGEEVPFDIYEQLYSTDSGCSWNELSGRYKELTPRFYIPTAFRGNVAHGSKQQSHELTDWDAEAHATEYDLMQAECNIAYANYQTRLDRGVARELARMCLPQSIYTEVVWTISLQAIIHMLQQRLKPDAQHEIRAYAEAIKALIQTDLDRLSINFS